MKCCNLFICRRVTAFLLLLLLSFTLLSSAIVRAEDKTYAKDFVSKVHYSYTYKGKDHSINYFSDYRICTDGKLVCVTYFCRDSVQQLEGFAKFYLSTSPIYYLDYHTGSSLPPETKLSLANVYHDIYYVPSGSAWLSNSATDFKISYSGLVNIKNVGGSNWLKYLESDIDNGYFDLTKDNYRDPDPDTDGTLSNSIPTPKIHVNKDYSFGFDNCTDDYYIQMQGRFWSVDDIELYKESMMWKYRYNSSIKGDLNDWYTAGSKIKANSGNLSFLENGQACFDEFLQQHPVNERSFYGGTNAVGNYFSGYNNALDTIKMLLGQPTSGYNGVDVYVRYFTYTDTGDLIYGKWCHYYDDIAKNGSSGSEWDDDDTLHNSQQSVNGMTDREKEENEKNDDPRKSDLDATLPTPDSDYKNPGIDIDFDSDLNFWTALNSFSNILNSSMSLLGDFPAFVSTVFGFLPSSVIVIISLGIISVIILRFIGR